SKKIVATVINRTIIEPARMTFGDVGRLMQIDVDLGRMAAGLSTDHVSADLLTVEGLPGSGDMNPQQIDDAVLELVQRAISRRQAKAITLEDVPESELPVR